MEVKEKMMNQQKQIARAADLLQEYGRFSNDYFKLWPGKKYYFSKSNNGFVAYGVSGGVAQ